MPRFKRASNQNTAGGEMPPPHDSFDNMPFDDGFDDRDKAELGELLGGGLPSGRESDFDDDMPLFDDSLPPSDQPTAASREDDVDLRKSLGVLFKAISDRIKGKKAQPSSDFSVPTDGWDDGLNDFVEDDFPDNPPDGNAYGEYPEQPDAWNDDLSQMPVSGDGYDESLSQTMPPVSDSTEESPSIGARLTEWFGQIKDKLTRMRRDKPVADEGMFSDDHGEFSDFIEWEEQGQETKPKDGEVVQNLSQPYPYAANVPENSPFEGEYGALGHEVEGESYPYAASVPQNPMFEGEHGADEHETAQNLPAEHDRSLSSINSPISKVLAAVGHSWRQFRRRLPSFKPKVYTVSVPDYQPEEDGIQAPSLVSDIEKIIRKQSQLGDVEREYEEMRSYIRSVDVSTAPGRDEIAPPENLHEVHQAENELFDLIRQIDVQNEQQRSRIGIYDPPQEEDPYNYRGINDYRQTYEDIEDASFEMSPRLSFESEQRIDPNRQWNERQAFGSSFDLRGDFGGEPAAQENRAGRFAPRQRGGQDGFAPEPAAAQENRAGRFAPRQRGGQGGFAPEPAAAQENRAGRFAPRQRGGQDGFVPQLAAQENRVGRFAPRQRERQDGFAPEPVAAPENLAGRFAPRQRGGQDGFAPEPAAAPENRSGRFAPRQRGGQGGLAAETNHSSVRGNDAPNGGNAFRESRKAKVRKRRNMADR